MKASSMIKPSSQVIQASVLLQRISFLLVVFALGEYTLFLFDVKLYGNPTIRQNNCFDIGHILGHKATIVEKCIFNFLLFMPFICTHLILARESVKAKLQSMWTNYVFFERTIFISTASFTLLPITFLFQPDNYVVLSLNFIPFLHEALIVGKILSLVFFTMSVIDMGHNDIFGFGRSLHFQKHQGTELPVQVKLSVESPLRRACRNPLYSSLIMMILVHSTEFTIPSILFSLTFLWFIYEGTLCEERELNKDKSFQEYKSRVPNRFILDIRAFMSSDHQKKRQ